MKEYKLGMILGGIVILVLIAALTYSHLGGNSAAEDKKGSKKEKKKGKNKEAKSDEQSGAESSSCVAGKLIAAKTWEMPKSLKEISGMAWMGEDKVCAVQDQKGIIYIYDLQAKKIANEIRFSDNGDYEGIAYAHNIFFVMRSDGQLYEVNATGKVVKQYDLPLTETDNIESLFFDAPNDRLLIGQKDGAGGSKVKKVFSFDLPARKFNNQPVYTLDMADPVISCDDNVKANKKGKKHKEIRPSEIAVNPATKDIYIADGPSQRVLVLSADGKPKYYLEVDKKEFPQVEGLMFDPAGAFYISTEGVKEAAKISQVNVEKTAGGN
ncbi:hypothetical protein DYU05_17150 [Mucilaginibacter terrenus]|uniref:Uncharacterized protein n=1 Tax=Mucilaginibacter terrenus TaxID=2482727 RepID=A0A3E2NMV6_9SPHI|nr:hypothetical protein [Mucilaginibacter terrenus]RFZ82336.1 hypothetical protein DYU05_17150 [Mucilaginibacter terrenus]